MKFSEYLNEEKEVRLLDKAINGELITPKTRNTIWKDEFNCSHQNLTSLEGAPKKVNNSFNCSYNNLKSLEGGPEIVHIDFECAKNNLTSLKGAPREVGGYFWCDRNKLTSLEGAPSVIGDDFDGAHNKLKSLKDIHKIITKMNGDFFCTNNKIKSHVLGLLLIPGIKRIVSDDIWGQILTKHLGKGRAGLIDAQNELIEAGLEEYAQL